jgi:hypothetical protein
MMFMFCSIRQHRHFHRGQQRESFVTEPGSWRENIYAVWEPVIAPDVVWLPAGVPPPPFSQSAGRSNPRIGAAFL